MSCWVPQLASYSMASKYIASTVAGLLGYNSTLECTHGEEEPCHGGMNDEPWKTAICL
jgi:hypothetical protein